MSEIKVTINGKEKEFLAGSTIQNVLDILEIKSPMMVVEKNLKIIAKENYETIIEDGDIIEIVGFFGGG